MPWLAGLQRSLSGTVQGDGRAVALTLAIVSLALAAAVWTRWRREALVAAIFWVLGQSLGGLTTGTATDPNIGPLFVLLAFALWPRCAIPKARSTVEKGRGPNSTQPSVYRIVPIVGTKPRFRSNAGELFAERLTESRIKR